MSVVVDASVVVATTAPSREGESARERLDAWHDAGEDLHVPNLFVYEVANALAGLEASGVVTARVSAAVWRLVDALDLTSHPPSEGAALITIAHRLRRRSAYDAAYVDVALFLAAELWTLDGKLARNAESVGLPVILLV